MSLLYVGCIKFPTNHFVGNFCPLKKKKKKKKTKRLSNRLFGAQTNE
jgi:hypothetical protein